MAKLVNVISNEEGKSDIYNTAAIYIEKKLANPKDKKLILYKDSLSKIIINRSIMKIPIMTIPYNISLEGITKKIVDSIVEQIIWENNKPQYKIKPEFVKDISDLYLNGSAFGCLCYAIHISLYDIVPILKPLIEYFISMVRLLISLNLPIVWITPSNMKINMSNKIFKSHKTKTKLINTARPITISIPTNMLDVKANVRGFVANLIHSLDASHINLIIKNIIQKKNQDKIPLYTIHDCFATTPYNMNKLNNIVLTSFIEQYYESNYIRKLHQNLLEQITSFGIIIIKENDVSYIIDPNTNEKIYIPKIPQEILDN